MYDVAQIISALICLHFVVLLFFHINLKCGSNTQCSIIWVIKFISKDIVGGEDENIYLSAFHTFGTTFSKV